MGADELARFMHETSRHWREAHGVLWVAWEQITGTRRETEYLAVAEAVLAELGRPAPLVVDAWTREPRADGYYWFRWIYSREWEVAKVCQGYAYFPRASRAFDTDELRGEWCGPLVPPGESGSP